MRKTILLVILISMLTTLQAQPPEAFKYQAVARDVNGDPLINQSVTFRFNILQTTSGGTTIYQEIHPAVTNSFGMANLEIGTGVTTIGDFSTISWGSTDYFLKVEMDPLGGTSYQDMGTSKFLSVPYAIHAKSAESTTPAGSNGYIQYNSSGILAGEANLFWNSTSKRLGVGTSLPSSKLHLFDAANSGDLIIEDQYPFLELNSTSSSANSGIKFLDQGAYTGWIMHSLINDAIVISGENNSVAQNNLVVANTGMVGINTFTPDHALSIEGEVGISGDIIHIDDADTYLSYLTDRMQFNAGGVRFLDLYEGSQDSIRFGDGSDIDFNFNNQAFLSGYNGRLGIGTKSPSFELDIHPSSSGGLRVNSPNDAFLVLDKGATADNSFIALRSAGSDKWVVGTWNTNNDFMIKNWDGGGSSDNTFVIDDVSSAIGLNITTPSSTDMLGLYPDNDFNNGIYMDNDRTTAGLIYGAYFNIDNTYSGDATMYGVYSNVQKTGASNSSIYTLRGYADDDQTGTSYRYLYGVVGSTNVLSTIGTSYAYGVYGSVTGSHDAGYGVYYSGGLGGSGTKSAVVRTPDGPKEVYCQESPGNWFEDFGEGSIHNGQAVVQVPADYLQTVTISSQHPMKVFITPNANLGNWWVEKRETSFIVHAPAAADGAGFDFRIVAKRQGYEDIRLRESPAAYTDHLLYPDINDVPSEHRAEWVRMIAPDDRDPSWMGYLSAADQQMLLEEIHPERQKEAQSMGTGSEKSTPEQAPKK